MVISGPAGSGKSTLCDRLEAEFGPRLQRAVTATTRPPRRGEVNQKDYHFLSHEEFHRQLEAGNFYEHAVVHGRHRYGTLKPEVRRRLERGRDVLLQIDVQGVQALQELQPDDAWLRRLVTVFLMPAGFDQLEKRLRERSKGRETDLERRLETARREIAQADCYGYHLVSGKRDADYDRVRAIYLAETMRRV